MMFFKRTTAIALAAVLIFTFPGVSRVNAAGTGETEDCLVPDSVTSQEFSQAGEVFDLNISPKEVKRLHDYAIQHQATRNAREVSGTYYALLDTNMKKIYDGLDRLTGMPRVSSDVDTGHIGLSDMKEQLSRGCVVTCELNNVTRDEADTAFKEAIYAYQYDHPTRLEISLCYEFGYVVTEGSDIILYMGLQETGTYDYDAMEKQIIAAGKEAVAAIKKDPEFLPRKSVAELMVYDYLLENVKYGEDGLTGTFKETSTSKTHTVYGALVEHYALCDGIAMAFEMMLTDIGVKTYVIGSESHAWNLVELEDGCYETDVTWEINHKEKTGSSNHLYFNLKTSEMRTVDGIQAHYRSAVSLKLPLADGSKYTWSYIRRIIEAGNSGTGNSGSNGTGEPGNSGTDNPGNSGTDNSGTGKPGDNTKTDEKEIVTGERIVGGVSYELKADKTAECIGVVNKKTKIVIPDEISYGGNEYRVISIGANAFRKTGKLRRVIIPASVTRIGSRAFADCRNLVVIRIDNADTLTQIGSGAFDKTSKKLKFRISGTDDAFRELVDKLKSAGASKSVFKHIG